MSLLSVFLGKKQTERAAMITEYAEIMARFDDPDEGDEDRLSVIMDALGLSIETVTKDAELFDQQRKMLAVIATIPALEADLVAKRTVHTTNMEAYQAAKITRDNSGFALDAAASRRVDANTMQVDLRALQAKYPRLTGNDWK